MNKIKVSKIAVAMLVILSITACSADKDGNRVTIKEPGKNITVIEEGNKETGEPTVSVEKIDQFKNLEISDWLKEDTVVVSKENTSLEKMRLEELSDLYPRSLYLYNLKSKEYELLKDDKNLFLGGAVLSSDNKHLLYHGNSLGDPTYYVMNLDTLESFGIHDDNIAAYSAEWADHEMIIGGSYSGGAYLASTAGKLTSLAGLQEEAVYIVRQMKDKVYYNTNFDGTLKVLNLATKEKKSLDINNVHGLYPAPDGNQMLVLQDNGSKKTMILCDADGGNIQTIAEGVEIGGISWSPDQQLIAYSMKAVVNGATVKGLYVYDMLTGKENQIVVDVESPATSWSPSGRELAYMEWNGVQYDSSIVYLNYSLQK